MVLHGVRLMHEGSTTIDDILTTDDVIARDDSLLHGMSVGKNKPRTVERIFIKFGIDFVPLVSSPKSYFLHLLRLVKQEGDTQRNHYI